jgi:hypothetical protein
MNSPSASSHKWKAYRRRGFLPIFKARATIILRSVREERATQKIGKSAIGPSGWLEKGSSASLLVRYVSQRIRSSLAPCIQTLLKPTVCLPLMRRCTSARAHPAFPISGLAWYCSSLTGFVTPCLLTFLALHFGLIPAEKSFSARNSRGARDVPSACLAPVLALQKIPRPASPKPASTDVQSTGSGG